MTSQHKRPRRRDWLWVLDVLAAGIALLVIVRLLGLDRGWPAVPAMALVPYLVPIVALCAAVSMMVERWSAAATAGVTMLALIMLVAPRGLPGPDPSVPPDGPKVTVMAVNLLGGQASPDAVMELIGRYDVDVLSVVELTPDAVADLQRVGVNTLLPHRHLDPRPGPGGSGLYSRWPLEPVDPVYPQGVFSMPRALVAVPDAAAVEVTAVHPRPPTGPSAMTAWEQALAALPPTDEALVRILAGDFNATLDHRAFRAVLDRGYVDAADSSGVGLTWTWNAIPHGRLAPPAAIDHILVDQRVQVLDTAIEPLSGSDHRAVISRLRLPDADGS